MSTADKDSPKLNPWLNIWWRPGDTVEHQLSHNPGYALLPLALLCGIDIAFSCANSSNIGWFANWQLLTVLSIAIGCILGPLVLYASAWCLYVTGRWFGGLATPSTLRVALAWSYAPCIITVGIVVVQAVLFGRLAFIDPLLWDEFGAAPQPLYQTLSAVSVVFALWSLVICVVSVARAQVFSWLRAIVSLILATIPVAVVVLIIVLILDELYPMVANE